MSPTRLPLLLCGALAALAGFAHAQVVINEFQYDDSGTDDREYVELFNAGNAAVDISGWQLRSMDQVGPNLTYVVQSSTILAPGGFWVMGSANVPNVNQIVTGPSGGLWENDEETIELWDATGTILFDHVTYEANKALFPLPAQAEGEGVWGNFTSIDGLETSWSRHRDGYDTDNNGRDFRIAPATPGTSNDIAPALPYFEGFDSYAIDAAVSGWGSSFSEVHAVDPTVSSLQNPNAVAASPVGGMAAIFWDATGGGNYNMLLSDSTDNVVFEAYVYMDALPRPTGEYETWSMLLQGGSGTYHNHPDPVGEIANNLASTPFTANGNVGVGLVYTITQNGGTLYLMDHNDGGTSGGVHVTPPVVLDQISVQQGVNDGWQRVRIQATGGLVEAFFGGTYGAFDGTRMAAPIDGGIGGIGIGYREFMVNNSATRPPTLDFVTIRANAATVDYYGTATPTTTDTPQIAASSFPFLGNPHFGIDVSHAPAGVPGALILGFLPLVPPLDLTPLGAQPNSGLFLTPDVPVSILTDANGKASLSLALPNTPALAGGSMYAQALVFDTALPFSLPIAQTRALHTTLNF